MTRPPNTNGASTAAKRTLEEGKKIGERGAATAEAVARSGLSSASELANRSAGEARKGMEQLSTHGEAAVRRAQQSMGTAADAGGALMNGAQEISQAWMDLAQDRMQRMADGMRALATCRTPADLMKAQSELLQGAVEQMIDTNRRVADVSMRVMQEVTAKVTAPIKGDLT
jgi:phasin family protein